MSQVTSGRFVAQKFLKPSYKSAVTQTDNNQDANSVSSKLIKRRMTRAERRKRRKLRKTFAKAERLLNVGLPDSGQPASQELSLNNYESSEVGHGPDSRCRSMDSMFPNVGSLADSDSKIFLNYFNDPRVWQFVSELIEEESGVHDKAPILQTDNLVFNSR